MQPSRDRDWYDRGIAVPLTGREPLLRRLKEALSRRTGGTWLTLTSPRGGGITRVLREIGTWIEARGGSAPLFVRAAAPEDPPLESLRRALQAFFPQPAFWSLVRALHAIQPNDRDAAVVLAHWLLGDNPTGVQATIEPRLVRKLIERLAGSGPILVDELERLDGAAVSVLLGATRPGGPVVLAGQCGSSPFASCGTVIVLEPLSEGQIELMLKRWLRHTATARRLAPRLAALCDGWPGRVCEAVRQLGRNGILRLEARGVVFTRAPATWPDGRPARRTLSRRATRDAATQPTGAGTDFDAALRLAVAHLADEDLLASRESLREAGRFLPSGDLYRRAAWHRALASLAARTHRSNSERTHLRRAARMFLACGAAIEAASMLQHLGAVTADAERPRRALPILQRAAHLHDLLGDDHGRAVAHLDTGRLYVRFGLFQHALAALHVALTAAEHRSFADLQPTIHHELAVAYRGVGRLSLERHHAEMAASLARSAADRVRAVTVLAQADMRAGLPGAERLLASSSRDLATAGFGEEAGMAQAALFDARLRAGRALRAEEALPVRGVAAPVRLAASRLAFASGRDAEACAVLEVLSADMRVAVHLRATAYTHLADGYLRAGELERARAAAVAASALLEAPFRSRAEDARLHRILARVFREVGEHGRAVGQRAAARRCMRVLARAVGSGAERRRLVRSFWRRDPRPDQVA